MQIKDLFKADASTLAALGKLKEAVAPLVSNNIREDFTSMSSQGCGWSGCFATCSSGCGDGCTGLYAQRYSTSALAL
jgi:hypothetical protein